MERRSEDNGRPALRAGLAYYRRSVIASAPVATPNRPTAWDRYSGGINSSRRRRAMSVLCFFLECWDCHGVKVFVRTSVRWNGADGRIVQSERSRAFDFHANSYWDIWKCVLLLVYPSQTNGSIEC